MKHLHKKITLAIARNITSNPLALNNRVTSIAGGFEEAADDVIATIKETLDAPETIAQIISAMDLQWGKSDGLELMAQAAIDTIKQRIEK